MKVYFHNYYKEYDRHNWDFWITPLISISKDSNGFTFWVAWLFYCIEVEHNPKKNK